jgi:hypothetical protein
VDAGDARGRYRLKQNGRELVSPDIAVGVNSHRYWLLRVDPAAGGIGSGSLIVRGGWTPREIVFTARGTGPFRLAYGNSRAQTGALEIGTLVPGWRTDQEPQNPWLDGRAKLAGESDAPADRRQNGACGRAARGCGRARVDGVAAVEADAAVRNEVTKPIVRGPGDASSGRR